MITETLFGIAGILVTIVSSPFKIIEFALPVEFFEAIEWAFAQFFYVDFIIPAETFMRVAGIYFSFIVVFYTIQIFIWAYQLVRHARASHKLPKIRS